jgi:hypothetical protein
MAYEFDKNGNTINPAENEPLELLAGSNLTFSSVRINTAGTQSLLSQTVGQTQRLHALTVTLDAAGTVSIQDGDNNILAGPWFLGTNDDSLDIFRGDSGNCAIQSSSTGAGLQIVATGGNCRGQASVSTG